MLSITNLSLQYSGKYLFREVSAQIHSGDRVGLVGVNGAGKSTLMRIMCGAVESDPGVINRAGWFPVAYLPQEQSLAGRGRTLYEEAQSAFDTVLAQQEELEELNRQLADISPDDAAMDSLLARQGELQHLLEDSDLFRMRPRIEQVLFGLGFKQEDLDRDLGSFSGGWIMRLLLAKLLLQKPALLLLDEPTNHLDLDSLTWLEDFLLQYQGAMVLISHDRAFLDRITSITWELSLGKLSVFRGNYSHYLAEKAQRLELERAAYDNQQALIRQTERFITRFRAKSTKARQVQSRVKQLEKMELIELSETERSIRFGFPPAVASGRDVLTLQGVGKSFKGKKVFQDMSFSLQRGDKLAVIGVNGAGKTTLLKILAGLEKAEGDIKYGHHVMLSYFGQHQAQELAGELSIVDTVYHAATEMSITQVRSLLGAFLFTGDAVEKQVRVLSGGEKSRVALAKMLVRPANLMLLDEPTNHLDMSSQEVLQEAMAQYEGTIIVVSHNRFFVNSFVNKVLEIKDGRATLHQGNIDDYLERRQQLEAASSPDNASGQAAGAVPDNSEEFGRNPDRKELRRQRAQERQALNKKLGPWKKKNDAAEAEIERQEVRKTELEALMADPELYSDQQRWAEVSREYAQVDRHLERAYQRWEEAQEAMSAIEADLND
ncbi:MAG: ABC-F family ATP-binding cassette domain-containing protein [Desulfobulbaceae bacterium]|nr:ABC-F family ATP-binding cassette domain-containing protein [Desulfobulbaceae bacterium]